MQALQQRPVLVLLGSAAAVAGGAWLVAQGDALGWLVVGFFGLCFLAVLWRRLRPEPPSTGAYRLVLTESEIACEHPQRAREAISWNAITKVWYVTTADGPWLPNAWLVFEGTDCGCSVPTEAEGFDGLWAELKRRYPDFDYAPLVRGGTNEAKYCCWPPEPKASAAE